MWTRHPGGTELKLSAGRSKQSSRLGRKRSWSRLCSATALGSALCLATAGASAGGVHQPAAAHGTINEFKLACSNSFEQSQRLRNGSQYVAATDEAVKCADLKCGEALFAECTKIYDQLQTATPSVVFAAKDDSGREITGVVVTIDGRPSRDQLDGKPVRVDPGSHQFAFSSNGYQRTEQDVLIRAGEQFRLINAILQRTQAADAAASSQRPTSAPEAPRSVLEAPRSAPEAPRRVPGAPRSVPLASYVLGAVSVVGLGAFVGFRLAASSRFDTLERTCKPNCSASQVDSVRQKYNMSDIALGIGAAAAVAAVTVYLVSPREHGPLAALQVSPSEHRPLAALQVSPSEHGISAGILGQF